jgi:ribosomal-protein-alanine N-acetyltransferase
MHPTLQPQIQKTFPILDVGDIILREKRDSDVEDFFAYYVDPEVHKFILCEIPQNIEEARRELHYWRGIFYQNDGVYFAIADKETDKMLGSIGLTGYNAYHGRIEISYDLGRQYWGLGIMSDSIDAIVKYCFTNLHCGRVNRIEAFTAIDNIPSKNLLLKKGFAFEGTLRQHRYYKGNYVDANSFSFLRQDFNNLSLKQKV